MYEECNHGKVRIYDTSNRASDIYRKLKFMQKVPEGLVEGVVKDYHTLKVSHITGVKVSTVKLKVGL